MLYVFVYVVLTEFFHVSGFASHNVKIRYERVLNKIEITSFSCKMGQEVGSTGLGGGSLKSSGLRLPLGLTKLRLCFHPCGPRWLLRLPSTQMSIRYIIEEEKGVCLLLFIEPEVPYFR